MKPTREQQIAALESEWRTEPRWSAVSRNYSAADVVDLRGSLVVERTLARVGAELVHGYRGRHTLVPETQVVIGLGQEPPQALKIGPQEATTCTTI